MKSLEGGLRMALSENEARGKLLIIMVKEANLSIWTPALERTNQALASAR